MKRRRLIIILIVLALFFVIKRKIELSRAPVFGKNPVLVSVFYSARRDVKNLKEYLAKVEPVNQAKVSTRINAAVEKVYVDEGSIVNQGDLLAELDKKDIMAKLNSAEQALSAAQENFNYWQKEYSRDENLFEKGAISQEERDRTKNSFAQAKARLAGAEGNVKIWQDNLAYARIRSPYSGIVSKRFVDPGDLAAAGRPLFIVEDRSRLKLAFDVPQEDTGLIKKGAPVIYKGKSGVTQVKISNVFPSLGEGRVLRVEAYLKNKGGLNVGEFIPVKVLTAEKKDVVVVPQISLCKDKNLKPFVFIVKSGRLQKYPVVLGLSSAMFVEVKNLGAGIPVVKNPYLSWVKLAGGQKVKVINRK